MNSNNLFDLFVFIFICETKETQYQHPKPLAFWFAGCFPNFFLFLLDFCNCVTMIQIATHNSSRHSGWNVDLKEDFRKIMKTYASDLDLPGVTEQIAHSKFLSYEYYIFAFEYISPSPNTEYDIHWGHTDQKYISFPFSPCPRAIHCCNIVECELSLKLWKYSIQTFRTVNLGLCRWLRVFANCSSSSWMVRRKIPRNIVTNLNNEMCIFLLYVYCIT